MRRELDAHDRIALAHVAEIALTVRRVIADQNLTREEIGECLRDAGMFLSHVAFGMVNIDGKDDNTCSE